MIRSIILAATAILAASAAGASVYSQKEAEKYIRDSEAAWVAAEKSGDPSVAERSLAEDYVGVYPDGTIVNKSSAVAMFKPNVTLGGHLDYLNVRFFGDTAVAQGKETDQMPPSSKMPSGSFIFTDVWLYRHGQWQIVNSEDQFQPLHK